MSQIIKNENGNWAFRAFWFEHSIDPVTGKTVLTRKSKFQSGFNTKRQAQIALGEFESRQAQGESVLANPPFSTMQKILLNIMSKIVYDLLL